MPVERVARLPPKCWEQLLEAKIPTASGRTNVRIDGAAARSVTFGACTSRGTRIAAATKEMSSLLQLAHEIARERPTGFRVPYLACTLNTSPLPPHTDNNSSISCVLTAADYQTGGLHIGEQGEYISNPGQWILFDSTCKHSVPSFEGKRASIVYYTPRFPEKLQPYLRDLEHFGFPVAEWATWFQSAHPAICWPRTSTCFTSITSSQLLATRVKSDYCEHEFGQQGKSEDQGMGVGGPQTRTVSPWHAMGALAVGSLALQVPCTHEQSFHVGPCQEVDQSKLLPRTCEEPVAIQSERGFTELRSQSSDRWRICAEPSPDVAIQQENNRIPFGVYTSSRGHEEKGERKNEVVAMCKLPQSLEANTVRGDNRHGCEHAHDRWDASGKEFRRNLQRLAGVWHMGSETDMDIGVYAPEPAGFRQMGREPNPERADGGQQQQGINTQQGSNRWKSHQKQRDCGTCSGTAHLDGTECVGTGCEQQRRRRQHDGDTLTILWQGQVQDEDALTTWVERQLEDTADSGEQRTLPRKVRKKMQAKKVSAEKSSDQSVCLYPEWARDEEDEVHSEGAAEEEASQVWEPSERQLQDLQIAHNNLGHPTPIRMAQILSNAGAHSVLVKYVRGKWKCPTCQRRAKPDAPRPAAIPRSYEVNQVVGVDLMEIDSPSSEQSKILLINVIDWCSHYQQ
eukprot:1947929-Amphidinium_carterae.4